MRAQRLKIKTESGPTSGLWQSRTKPIAVLVVAHGAGGDMESPFLAGFAEAVADSGIAVLRFNFLYKEEGRKAPDPQKKLEAAWRGAFAAAATKEPTRQLYVCGKSLGGRIGSMCVAEGLPAKGLVFLGYPLHPPGKPDKVRDAHLYGMRAPMLFIEGTRDPFATPGPLKATMKKLGKRAEQVTIAGGDHSFRVKGEPVDDSAIGASIAEHAVAFVRKIV